MSSQKIILITGANSGVGYAASKVMASHSPNIHVIMTGRNLTAVKAARQELLDLEPAGTIQGTLSAVELDVTSPASIAAAVASVTAAHPHLDALVNNAAVGSRQPDLRTRLTEALTTNAIGAALVAEAFRPLLLKSTDPYSVWVSSGAGSFGSNIKHGAKFKLEYDEAYRVSKAAQNMLAFREWMDFGPQGLKVFAMTPGLVVSNLRGKSEKDRTFDGTAGDPDVAGRTLLKIVLGERDADVGKFLSKDGVEPW